LITSETILGHVKWAALGTWGGKLVALAIFILLTRLLPVEVIGAVSLIAVYLSLLQLIGEAGLAEYLVQHQQREQVQEQSLFWLQLFLSSSAAAALWYAAPWVTASMPASVPGESLVHWMCLSLPLVAAARVPDALMRKALSFKQLAYRNLIAALCGGVAGVVCALQDLGVWALVVKQLVENAVALGAVMVGARWRPRFMFSRAVLGPPLRYGLAVFGTRAIGVIHGRLDSLIVGWLLGATALGFYSVALRVYQIANEMFNSVIDAVSVPLIARVKSDANQLRSIFVRLVRGSSLLSMTAFASLCALAPLIVAVTFGSRWSESGVVLRWLAVVGFITGPLWFNGGMLLATGRAARWMFVVAAYVVLGALLLPIAATLGGIAAVAIAMVLRALLMAPVSVSIALRAAQLQAMVYCRAWLPSALIGASVGASAWLASVATLAIGVRPSAALLVGASSGLAIFLLIVPIGSPGIWRQLIDMLRRRDPQKE
jgi:O-antigen/teichoic acid export membrane protein